MTPYTVQLVIMGIVFLWMVSNTIKLNNQHEDIKNLRVWFIDYDHKEKVQKKHQKERDDVSHEDIQRNREAVEQLLEYLGYEIVENKEHTRKYNLVKKSKK